MAPVKDTFANRAYVKIVESSANTLTFKEMESGFGILEKRAWVISRIEYFLGYTSMAYLVDTADSISMGVSLSNKITDTEVSRPEVVDKMIMLCGKYGTAANITLYEYPKVHDFSDLPGGGILLTPKPIFGFIAGISLADVVTVELRIYFTVMTLKDADFLQLLEMTRMIQ